MSAQLLTLHRTFMPLRRRHPLNGVLVIVTSSLVLIACSATPRSTANTSAIPPTSVVAVVSSTAAAPEQTAIATATTEAAATTAAPATIDPTGPVLPVAANPISNNATDPALTIDSVLVENNVDPSTGKVVDDHLEIALTNSSGRELGGVEIFYTFSDPATSVSESYYLALPTTFTIAPGAHRIVHFDTSTAADHFPINKFSLYKTSTSALDVTVMVSAISAAPVLLTVTKDAGGAETAD
jgi:hypothetical protein